MSWTTPAHTTLWDSHGAWCANCFQYFTDARPMERHHLVPKQVVGYLAAHGIKGINPWRMYVVPVCANREGARCHGELQALAGPLVFGLSRTRSVGLPTTGQLQDMFQPLFDRGVLALGPLYEALLYVRMKTDFPGSPETLDCGARLLLDSSGCSGFDPRSLGVMRDLWTVDRALPQFAIANWLFCDKGDYRAADERFRRGLELHNSVHDEGVALRRQALLSREPHIAQRAEHASTGQRQTATARLIYADSEIVSSGATSKAREAVHSIEAQSLIASSLGWF